MGELNTKQMRKTIMILMLLSVLTASAGNGSRGPRVAYDRNTGYLMVGTGLLFSAIAITVPDGGDWTYSSGYNSQVVHKPFFQQPARVSMLGIGVIVSIGGLVYDHNNKNR